MENETGLKIFFWIVTAIMLFSVFTVLLVVTLHNRRTYRMKQKESKTLMSATFEAERMERKRIAEDLHDEVSGDLNAIQYYVTKLSEQKEGTIKKEELEKISSMLSKTLNHIQNISYNLMPPMLQDYGLILTLQSYFNRISQIYTIEVTQEYLVKELDLSTTQSHELFRTIQELTTNMIKHGNANKISLSVSIGKGSFFFDISDNGKSFDFYKSLKKPKGMGIKNIISRLSNIDATLIQLKVMSGNKFRIAFKTTETNDRKYTKNSNSG